MRVAVRQLDRRWPYDTADHRFGPPENNTGRADPAPAQWATTKSRLARPTGSAGALRIIGRGRVACCVDRLRSASRWSTPSSHRRASKKRAGKGTPGSPTWRITSLCRCQTLLNPPYPQRNRHFPAIVAALDRLGRYAHGLHGRTETRLHSPTASASDRYRLTKYRFAGRPSARPSPSNRRSALAASRQPIDVRSSC